jgi:purine-nucleoside/S-methyl-5'-thioadenosine phosphorylase / adenosine deaminase
MSPTLPATATYRRRAGLDVLAWPAFDGLAVEALVTTRDGGVSSGPYASLNLGLHVGDDRDRVIENRRRAADALGLDLDQCVFAHQTHGREVAVVGAADRGRGTTGPEGAPACDALVTTTPGVGLAIMVADCVPLVLFEPHARVLAAVHAGWKGTVARVAQAAVEAMAALGARPASVVAGLGPAVEATGYQVGDEVAEAARGAFGTDVGEVLAPDGPGHWRFDLWAANRRVLVDAGVPPAQIEVAPVGTGPGTPFFSDRAARPCGRFAALAALA